jgi:DNA-binding XRE family transcriptional regulator
MNLSQILIDYRARHGITQTELANRLGMDQTTISAIELGKCGASMRTAAKIADLTGCQVSDLLRPRKRGSRRKKASA